MSKNDISRLESNEFESVFDVLKRIEKEERKETFTFKWEKQVREKSKINTYKTGLMCGSAKVNDEKYSES